MGLDVQLIMESLARKRGIFHSEADLQFALAWEIKELHPTTEVRLEYNARIDASRTYIDIWLNDEGRKTAIELKYKQASTAVIVNDEEFQLSNHLAPDSNCFLAVHDIYRLETLVRTRDNLEGYFIFVTNDQNYWNNPSKEANYDAFRVNEGAVLTGSLNWRDPLKSTARDYTRKYGKIQLRGEYRLHWKDYYHFHPEINRGTFKYLCVNVSPDGLG